MKRVSHILCPTDFSPISDRSTKLAVQLADELRAELTLLHVDTLGTMDVVDFTTLEKLRQETRQRIEKHLLVLRKKYDLSSARLEIKEGSPLSTVIDAVRTSGVDLLVMGTHGESGWTALHLGSFTEKALHASPVPLLVVPDLGKREPFRRKTRRILLAVDIGYTSRETVSYAVDMAANLGAGLDVVNVAYPNAELFPGLGSFWAREDLSTLKAELEQARTDALSKLLSPAVRRRLKVKLIVEEGEPHERIDYTARARKADLLIMGASGRGQGKFGWLGSTTHKVIRMGSCATWVVK